VTVWPFDIPFVIPHDDGSFGGFFPQASHFPGEHLFGERLPFDSGGPTMAMLYGICAAIGGTLLICQFIMTLMGLDHGGGIDDVPHDFGHDFAHDVHGGDAAHTDDAGHDHDASWFVGIVTLRTIVAALTFFGLAGLGGQSAAWPDAWTLVLAVAAGAGAMYIVHWIMRTLHRLRADGTVRIERAVGQVGSVYLRVPGSKSGVGKIQVGVQNRTMEYEAMTSQERELPVGARVVVTQVVGPDTVEVELVPEHERTAHA
jgi:hypothetical protein